MRLRRLDHEEAVGVVDHLDELRSRLIVSLSILVAAVAVCFWQNHLILGFLNQHLDGKEPITLGVTEPFISTLTVSLYAGLILALPLLLWQAYAFLLPALSPETKRATWPLMLAVPILFMLGTAFAWVAVIPQAIDFLQNFNDDQFSIQIRAKEYYSFILTALMALGLVFQLPVALLAAIKTGITSTTQLHAGRRYAVLAIAVVAMLMPGQDPITMGMIMLPLLVLYEGSLILASWMDRAARSAEIKLAETP